MADEDDTKEAEDLLGYAWLHCRTELALFHRAQLIRLYELAGETPTEILSAPWRTWWSAHREVVDPLVEKSRARLKPTPGTQWERLLVGDGV